MKIKTLSLYGALILTMFLVSSCAGVSAPPVDLPAPITGRVDVSSPDENGMVHITGTEGAVPGDSLVMAVNEDIAGTQVMLILDKLVRSAEAAGGLPAVCDIAGHACTQADSTGAFSLTVPGMEGQTIAIGIIDSTGAFISELLTVTIPSSGTPSPSANCAGQGLSGAVADIKIAPTTGEPIVLKKGSDTTTNELVIGSASPIQISGCDAHSLAVMQTAGGDIMVATSQSDKILWTGRLASGVRDRRSFTLTQEPMNAMFVGSASQPVVALKTATSVELASITLGNGAILSTMPIGNTGIPGLTRSTRLDVKQMGTYKTQYLGLAVTDTGDSHDSHVTIFRADTLEHLATWDSASLGKIASPVILPANISIVDGALFVGPNDIMSFAIVNTLDSGSPQPSCLPKYQIMKPQAVGLSWDENLDGVTLGFPKSRPSGFCMNGAAQKVVVSMKAITTGMATPPIGILSNETGNIYTNMLNDDAHTMGNNAWSPGQTFTAIAVDDVAKRFYGADTATGAAVDGTSVFTWLP